MSEPKRPIVEFGDINWSRRWAGHSYLGMVLAKIDHTSSDQGCWLWLGTVSSTGYGLKGILGRTYLAHRLLFELYYGPVPDALQLDHICRVRTCVNPEHLEPVTQRENIRRGFTPTAIVVATNRCSFGHELTPENTYHRPDGAGRQCRICIRRRSKKLNERRAARKKDAR